MTKLLSLFFIVSFSNLKCQNSVNLKSIYQSNVSVKNNFPIPDSFFYDGKLHLVNKLRDSTHTYFFSDEENPYKEVKVIKFNLKPIEIPASIAFIDYNLNGKFDDIKWDRIIYYLGEKDSIDLYFRNKYIKRVVNSKKDTFSVDNICYVLDYANIKDNYININKTEKINIPNLFITSIHNLDLEIGTKNTFLDLLENNEYLLLDLWFIHCPACIRGFPELNKINKLNQGLLRIIGVNGIDSKQHMEEFILSEKDALELNINISREELNQLGDESLGFPRYILISKNGDIIDHDIKINNIYKLLNDINNIK